MMYLFFKNGRRSSPDQEGGGGAMDREMFTLASKFSNKLSVFPNKDEVRCFPSDTRDFHPSA
jgi:hypothetical protein